MIRLITRPRSRPALALLFSLVALAPSGCGNSGSPAQNLPPTVSLTSGPVEGEEVLYRIRISWTGEDRDGHIDRYEYALDPPAAFSETEVAGAGEGVTSEFLAGDGSTPDRTRISKIVDGNVVLFDWVHTREFSRLFTFSSDEPESVLNGSRLVPSGRFTGMHAVYVRAVDDDGLPSIPDQVAFTATTVAPTATITRPEITDGFILAGSFIRVEWSGVDPDRDSGGSPVGYLITLYKLDPLPIICVGFCRPDLIRVADWTYAEEGSDGETFDLEPGQNYLVAVRAVDEAGAVEPFLEYGRNVFRVTARDGAGIPVMTLLHEGVTYVFSGDNGSATFEVPSGHPVIVELQCTAATYGETCNEFRWGLDIPDLEDETAWSSWTTVGTFTVPPQGTGIHVLYVQARDSLGQTVLGTIILDTVDLPFDKEVLLVDDSFDDTYPRDDDSDAFWQGRLDAYGKVDPARSGVWAMHGDQDRGSIQPQVPTLAELGRYRTLVWDNRGSGYNGVSGLFRAVITRTTLRTYLAAGGQLWLSGRMTVGATTAAPSREYANLIYPKLDLAPGDFAWDILKLHTEQINNDKGTFNDGRHNLVEAQPFPGRPETYPLLEVDDQKLIPLAAGRGIPFADAVFGPILAHQEPGFRGILDSLYAYGATGNVRLGKSSVYHQKLTGIRWHDPDPAREHGRIQWFGFPMYYMKDAQAQETFNRSLDWFREEVAEEAAP